MREHGKYIENEVEIWFGICGSGSREELIWC